MTLAFVGCGTAQSKIVENASTQDHKCLAQAIYYESGSEPLAGRHAVAHVVLNRVKSGLYPTSICEVVYQRNYLARGCQFSWSCRRHATPSGVRWQQAQEVATLVLAGKSEDTSRGATIFHGRNDRVNYSSKHYQKTAVIGGHTFYRQKKLQLLADNRLGDKK